MVLRYVGAVGVAETQAKRARRNQPKEPRNGGVMGLFTYFPLLAIPVVVYNLMAWGGKIFGSAGIQRCPELIGKAVDPLVCRLNSALFDLPMVGRARLIGSEGVTGETANVTWTLTSGDLLLALALSLLFVEILKSTHTGRSAIANHALSLIIFVFCLIEFLLFAPFATSVFFFITLMTLLDVLAGFIVTIVTARRDIAVGEGFDA